MLINPAFRLRSPDPIRRIWRRRVESVGAVAAVEPVTLGDRHAPEAAAVVEMPAPAAARDEHRPFRETDPLADMTIAGLNALRSADAEVAAPALLAGAKAHGSIDHPRLKLILRHLDEVGASEADRRYVLSHLVGPPDMQEAMSRVHDLTTAQETYRLASLMIDPEKPFESDWLAELRRRLRALAAKLG